MGKERVSLFKTPPNEFKEKHPKIQKHENTLFSSPRHGQCHFPPRHISPIRKLLLFFLLSIPYRTTTTTTTTTIIIIIIIIIMLTLVCLSWICWEKHPTIIYTLVHRNIFGRRRSEFKNGNEDGAVSRHMPILKNGIGDRISVIIKNTCLKSKQGTKWERDREWKERKKERKKKKKNKK